VQTLDDKHKNTRAASMKDTKKRRKEKPKRTKTKLSRCG
jgi:hypothetical protein